jgi:hypothetical protein
MNATAASFKTQNMLEVSSHRISRSWQEWEFGHGGGHNSSALFCPFFRAVTVRKLIYIVGKTSKHSIMHKTHSFVARPILHPPAADKTLLFTYLT